MRKRKAIILAVFKVEPILLMCAGSGIMMLDFFGGNTSGPPAIIRIILPLHSPSMLKIFILLVIYIVHASQTESVPQDKKALWAVVLFLGNMIAMSIYWYLYIWKAPSQSTSEEPSNATF